MKKKMLSYFLISTIAGAMVCGCAKQPESPESVVQSDDNAKSTTLRVWGATDDQELLQQLCNSFKSENPDCKLEIVIEPVEEGNCKDTLLNNIAEGADVFTFADDQLQSYVAAGVIDAVSNEAVKSANVEGAIQAATINDTLYAYPMTADNGYFMYYDKSVFTEEDVKTLDGMFAKANAAGKKVFLDFSSGWYLYSFFGNTGLEVGLNDDGISNFCTWNSSENAIKGVDVLNAIISVAHTPGFTASEGVVDGAKAGTVCAGISGVWDAAALQALWGDNLGATKLPTYTVNGQQIQMASFAGYKLIGVNAYSEHKEWAHKLAEYLTNEQSQLTRYQVRALGPSNIKAGESPEVSGSVALNALLEQSPYSKLQRVGGSYWTPTSDMGQFAIDGNPQGVDLQQYMDSIVEAITKKY